MNNALFSSSRDDWETPPDFFAELNEEFHFTLDACALPETAKCAAYFTPEDDGLSKAWNAPGGCCFLQPAVFEADEKQTRTGGVDQESRRGEPEARGRGGYAYSSPDGYARFSQVHIPQGGNSLYQGPPPFPGKRTDRRRGPVSEHGRNF